MDIYRADQVNMISLARCLVIFSGIGDMANKMYEILMTYRGEWGETLMAKRFSKKKIHNKSYQSCILLGKNNLFSKILKTKYFVSFGIISA